MIHERIKIKYCHRCGEALGEIFDGQVFRCRRLEIFHRTKLFCVCGNPFTFTPTELKDVDLTEEQKSAKFEILNELALSDKQHR
jgi:hypothetical protein